MGYLANDSQSRKLAFLFWQASGIRKARRNTWNLLDIACRLVPSSRTVGHLAQIGPQPLDRLAGTMPTVIVPHQEMLVQFQPESLPSRSDLGYRS